MKTPKSFTLELDVVDFLNKQPNASDFINTLVKEYKRRDKERDLEHLKKSAIEAQELLESLQMRIYQLEYEKMAEKKREEHLKKAQKELQKRLEKEKQRKKDEYLIKKFLCKALAEGKRKEELRRKSKREYPGYHKTIDEFLDDPKYEKARMSGNGKN